VVYAQNYEHLLFVQDGDEALSSEYGCLDVWLPGDHLLIKGKTQGSFRPLVVASSITLLHHGSLPKPEPATFGDLIQARYDVWLVKIDAKVRAADLGAGAAAPQRSARLQLVVDGGHIEADVIAMTEDEKRQQKAMLLLEFQEAESNLASLREKAGRIGRDMLEVGQWLGNMSPEQGPDTEYRKKDNEKRNAAIRASLGKHRDAMNFEVALILMDELQAAEKLRSSLALRKSELGLK
jgi:hypothetical protein